MPKLWTTSHRPQLIAPGYIIKPGAALKIPSKEFREMKLSEAVRRQARDGVIRGFDPDSVEPDTDPEPVALKDMSEDDLRAVYLDEIGEKPHHAKKAETLIEEIEKHRAG